MIRLTYPTLKHIDLKNIQDILESGWLTDGPWTQKFEKSLSEYLEIRHAVSVNSGTAALHIALHALGINKDDEVIVPDFTFFACANVVEHIGAKPVFADIDLNTFNITAESIETKITTRTRAIMPVHQFGQSVDMDKIREIADKYNLYIIEDAACALGSEYKNIKCGTLGDVGCFSFHPRKIITTGEGGILCTDNSDIAQYAIKLRNHGQDLRQGKKELNFCGYNYRLPEISAHLGVTQIMNLNSILEKRKKIASLYSQRLFEVKEVQIPALSADKSHNWQSYVVLINTKTNCDEIIAELRKRGIEASTPAFSLHTQPYYSQKYGYKKGELKNSFKASQKSIALPIHPMLSDKEVEYIVDSLIEVI
jgi:dTDP-4-amino-4,6-dideoxygalactose transaminase